MDEPTGESPRSGGSVEPAGSAQVRELRRPDGDRRLSRAVRYELRDPFEDVTYRFDHLPAVTAKADRLGALRFTAVLADGARVQVNLQEGSWRRSDGEPLDLGRPHRTASAAREREDNVVPLVLPPAPHVQTPPEREGASLDAERAAALQAALLERYVVKRPSLAIASAIEYRFRGDAAKVAFTETPSRLATDTNNPSVARSMMDLAESKGWTAVRVTGSDDFRRMVWLEAQLRGVQISGYPPVAVDWEVLQRERSARQGNRLDRSPQVAPGEARPSPSRKAVLATLEAVLREKRVPEAKVDLVMAAAEERLRGLARKGRAARVQVYDKSAPSRKAAEPRTPVRTRGRDQDLDHAR